MPRKRNKRQYFTQDTEDAIVEFNNSTDPVAKNRIYRDRIHYGFFKLTENIIHTFKFYHTEVDDLTHLQHEIICFLLELPLYCSSKSNISNTLPIILTF